MSKWRKPVGWTTTCPTPDPGLWSGAAHGWWNDGICGHTVVPSPWDHAQLDALQHDRYVLAHMQTDVDLYSVAPMLQTFLGWERNNSEGSFKRNEARKTRPVCTHCATKAVNRGPLYSLITIYSKWKTLKWNCGFWSTWSKNIWNESDVASTKSPVMCHSHIWNLCQTVKLSLCFLPQSPFGQLYVRSCAAVMLC